MPAPSKMKHLAEIAASLRRRKLAVSAAITLMAVLLLGPLALKPSALEIGGSSSASHSPASRWPDQVSHDPNWAGGLEAPHPQGQATAAKESIKSLTSASYTSGFDKKAAGLEPLPPEATLLKLMHPHDPRACPDDLNCSFRAAKSAVPPPRPRPPMTAEAKPTQPPAGFSLPLLPAHLPLPSPNSLLKSFAFVSNTVAGFVKKL